MTRPASHHEQPMPAQCCGNCTHAHVIQFKRDLLCFKGDRIEVQPGYNNDEDDVTLIVGLHRQDVSLLDGEEYSEVWGRRIVDPSDACDEWQANTPRNMQVGG